MRFLKKHYEGPLSIFQMTRKQCHFGRKILGMDFQMVGLLQIRLEYVHGFIQQMDPGEISMEIMHQQQAQLLRQQQELMVF